MKWRNGVDRYAELRVGLHWLMLLLLAAVFATMELRGYFPKGSATREAVKTWHYLLGLSAWLLAAARLLLALLATAAPITPPPPRWQRIAAHAMHGALYAFMLGMPLLGWATLSAQGSPILLFGIHLPSLIGADSALVETLEELHETGAGIGYVLIGLHAAAALYHHYVLRDNTLRRMLPRA